MTLHPTYYLDLDGEPHRVRDLARTEAIRAIQVAAMVVRGPHLEALRRLADAALEEYLRVTRDGGRGAQ